MKLVYLDKKDRIRAWFTARRSTVLFLTVLAAGLLPVWHETSIGRFVLEPTDHAVVRNLVPGMVTKTYADEGQWVKAGSRLLDLQNPTLQSKLARSQADTQVAITRATVAQLLYTDVGKAIQAGRGLAQQTEELTAEASGLELRSPIEGIILTPRISDRLGAYVSAGTELVEIAALTNLKARVYLSEHDMYKLRSRSRARLHVDGTFGLREASLLQLAPVSAQIPAGLIDLSKYKGLHPPNFYVADLIVPNPDHGLKPGMTGTARIYGEPASLAQLVWRSVIDFIERKVW